MARLLQHYEAVLLPFGNGRRYDLVVDDGKNFLRIQCKTGRLRSGCVIFNAHSTHWARGQADRGYKGQADFFGVYCPELTKVYLVPVDDVPETYGSLRVEPVRNGQKLGVRWAAQYELRQEDIDDIACLVLVAAQRFGKALARVRFSEQARRKTT
jgi:PD-(D/E)XK nuclease superfamily protein